MQKRKLSDNLRMGLAIWTGELVDDKFTGVIDTEKLDKFLAGEFNGDEIVSLAKSKSATMAAKISFAVRKDMMMDQIPQYMLITPKKKAYDNIKRDS